MLHRLPVLITLGLTWSALLASEAASPAEPAGEERIVITAPEEDSFREPLTESPALRTATSFVEREDLTVSGATDLGESLRYEPGMWNEQRGRKVAQFLSVRGQSYPYPTFAIDGSLQLDFHELPSVYPAEEIGSIRLHRSAGGLLMGLDGSVGTIEIRPRHGTRDGFEGLLALGSFGTVRSRLAWEQIGEDWDVRTSIGHFHQDGPSGENAAMERSDVFVSAGWRPDETLEIRLHGAFIDGLRELRAAQEPAGANLRDRRESFDPWRMGWLQGRMRWQHTDQAALDVALSYADRRHTYVASTVSAPDVETTSDEHDREWSLSVIESLRLNAAWTLRLGGLYNRQTAPEGKQFYAGHRLDVSTLSAVAAGDWRPDTGLIVDWAYRWTTRYLRDYGAFSIEGSAGPFRDVEPITDTWGNPVHQAAAGVSWPVDAMLTLTAHLSSGTSSPHRRAITENGDEPDDEWRSAVDIGLALDAERLGTHTISLFSWFVQDAIVLSGTTVEVDGEDIELSTNRDQWNIGLEWDSRLPLADTGFSLRSTGLLQMPQIKEDGSWERERRLPREILTLGLLYNDAVWEGFLGARWLGPYYNNRFLPGGSQPRQLARVLVIDAHVAYSPDERWRFHLTVDNATDEGYETVNGYPDVGLRIEGGAQLTF